MKYFYFFICFLFISTASFGQEIIFGKKEGPQFNIELREIITTTTINKTKKITVPFINDGTEPLVFSEKSSSCKCITTEVPKDIKPGQKAAIVIHFTPTRIGSFTETIYIQTNVKKHPQLLGFRAMVK